MGLVLLLLVVAAGIGEQRDAIMASQEVPDPIRRLPRSAVLKRATLGHRSIVADWYWVRSAIYFGDPTLNKEHYRFLFPLVDLITDLDPHFEYAYLFGGVALPTNLGNETWLNTTESTALLEKGVRVLPNSWHLRQILAYNQVQFHGNLGRAANLLAEAVRIPGRPGILLALATRLYAAAGRPDSGLALANEILETTEDPGLRGVIERRMKELVVDRDIRQLEAAIEDFRARHGRLPGALSDLVSSGFLRELPEEPLGGTYLLDPSSGEVRSSVVPDRLRPHLTRERPPK
ncbi:MAG: tetratricopeptide repeat protein [Myxococcota bacterium]